MGSIGQNSEILYKKGFDSIFSIIDRPISLEEAQKDAGVLLEKAAERIMRLLNIKFSNQI